MRTSTLAFLALCALATMIGMKALSRNEALEVHDGTPATGVLPLDRETSRVAFETATFGLG